MSFIATPEAVQLGRHYLPAQGQLSVFWHA